MTISQIMIRNYQPEDLPKVAELERVYRLAYPGTTKSWLIAYQHSPTFVNGRYIICAEDERGNLVAHAHVHVHPLYADEEQPSEDPHFYYLYIKVDPQFAGIQELQESLYEKLLAITDEIRQTATPRPTRLRIEQFDCETDIIRFYQEKGFTTDKVLYEMSRDLFKSIPEPTGLPEGVELRDCPMETDEDCLYYLKTANSCFPDEPMDLDHLKFVMGAPMWKSFTAFHGEAIVGSVQAIKIPWEKTIGGMDAVFVVEPYRGQGIAQAAIGAGLIYLKELGLSHVELNVISTNVPAVKVYTSMGFEKLQENWILGLEWVPTH